LRTSNHITDFLSLRHMVHTATLIKAADVAAFLSTETGIPIFKDGKSTREVPEAIKTAATVDQLMQHYQRQRSLMGPPPRTASNVNSAALAALAAANGGVPTGPAVPNGTPVSTMKHMQPPTLLQMRMQQQSNGMLRPTLPLPQQGSPMRQLSNGAPGTSPSKSPLMPHAALDGFMQLDNDPNAMVVDAPVRPKSVAVSNGYPAGTNGFPAPGGATYIPHHAGTNGGVPVHQMQDVKSAFANGELVAAHVGRPGFPTHVVASGTNFNLPLAGGPTFNLKLPPTRQTQWAQTSHPGMPGMNGSPLQAQAQLQAVYSNGGDVRVPSPMRTPSAGRIRSDAAQLLAPASPLPLARSPHLATMSPGPGAMMASPHQSPMRAAMSPVPIPAIPSPALQPVPPPVPTTH
jgi:hypothetical protein